MAGFVFPICRIHTFAIKCAHPSHRACRKFDDLLPFNRGTLIRQIHVIRRQVAGINFVEGRNTELNKGFFAYKTKKLQQYQGKRSPNSSSAPLKTLGTLILVNDYVIKCQSSIPYTLPFCAMFPILSVWRKVFSNSFRSGNRY